MHKHLGALSTHYYYYYYSTCTEPGTYLQASTQTRPHDGGHHRLGTVLQLVEGELTFLGQIHDLFLRLAGLNHAEGI